MEQQASDPFIHWLRIAFRVCGCLADAEDIVQRACLELIQNEKNPTDPSHEGLVKKVIVCRAIDLLRKRDRCTLQQITQDLPSNASGPERNLEEAESFDLLHRGLLKLPPMQAQTFVLRYLGDATLAEIASLLNCSENSVSVQLSKAKRFLQVYFKEYYDVSRRTTSRS